MRNLIFTVVLLTIGTSSLFSQKFRLGVGSEVIFVDDAYIAIQGRATYQADDKNGISLNANFHIGDSGWSADLDYMYTLFSIGESLYCKPFAGLNKDDGIALNLGVNLDIPINEKLLYAAPKFIIDKSSIFAFSVGILF
ncbi:MAG TPA: hypothetical protein PK147_08685 [Saprospiraceae bacterium]|nr:hypothetical protein [Saprospiraceae bacterium]MCB9327794.1 hypothetical protein [Lewinellaceae bacterium]HPK10116.1 hypothetical protein [Saprospiraceae bacterium]HPQ21914.1 hypothetical protein [Saprospiraceae bacterium]HRX27868.1 hypothetical protein [Saprospiraceae bacterium]